MNDQRTSRSIEEMRIDVLSRVAEACMTEGLKPPLDLHVSDYGMPSVTLIMDNDRAEQVDAWATFLSLPPAGDKLYDRKSDPWVCHKARAVDHDGGLWRGFESIEVWCAVRDPEQVARLSALAVLGA